MHVAPPETPALLKRENVLKKETAQPIRVQTKPVALEAKPATIMPTGTERMREAEVITDINTMPREAVEKAITPKSAQREVRQNEFYNIVESGQPEALELPVLPKVAPIQNLVEPPRPNEYTAAEMTIMAARTGLPVLEGEAVEVPPLGSIEQPLDGLKPYAGSDAVDYSPDEPASIRDEEVLMTEESEIITLLDHAKEKFTELGAGPAAEVERLFVEISTIIEMSASAGLSAARSDVAELNTETVFRADPADMARVRGPEPLVTETEYQAIAKAASGFPPEFEPDKTEQNLTVAATRLFQLLELEASEPQIKKFVSLLMDQQKKTGLPAQDHPADRGTHEILQYLGTALRSVEEVLEPLHTLLGRIVLATHIRRQPLLEIA